MVKKRNVNKLLIASISAVISTTTIPSITLASVSNQNSSSKVTQVEQSQSNEKSATNPLKTNVSSSKERVANTSIKVTESTYTIVDGDTLSKIALNFNTTVSNLMAWNNLKTDFIYAGQKLNVSKPSSTVKTVAKPSRVSKKSITTDKNVTNMKTYTVASGDTLSKIALKNNTTVENLKTWNHLKSDLIYIGQKINVSKSSSVQTVYKKSSVTTKKNTNKPLKEKTTSSNKIEYYVVVSGDSLSKIALKHNTSVENLKTWNKLKTDLIYVGQKLNVSKPTSINKTTEIKGNSTSNKKIISKASIKSNNTTTYIVKSGDSLHVIAKVFNVTVENLKTWNGLTSDLIYVGQKIKIEKPKKVTNSSNTSNSIQSINTKKYIVQSGDSLSVISKVYGVSVEDIKNWNNLKSDLIYIGQKLIIKK
ncbi:LysM peptidoglycan-binding domain-containing protein [Rummeliibacillus pycnus]|uniref:LysM peptidoglycan-binding domain-containing protein n=1 Tax=Rummeliibacillus pycnus TaxID=101070 RepID=UPI003D275E99